METYQFGVATVVTVLGATVLNRAGGWPLAAALGASAGCMGVALIVAWRRYR